MSNMYESAFLFAIIFSVMILVVTLVFSILHIVTKTSKSKSTEVLNLTSNMISIDIAHTIALLLTGDRDNIDYTNLIQLSDMHTIEKVYFSKFDRKIRQYAIIIMKFCMIIFISMVV